MDQESISGAIIMLICCWGSGILFWGIGAYAQKLDKPMHFWSGTNIDPKTVTDLYGYNEENGRLWKLFSVPFWITGILAIVGIWYEVFSIISAVVLALGVTAGLFWLIVRYKRIEKKYIRKT